LLDTASQFSRTCSKLFELRHAPLRQHIQKTIQLSDDEFEKIISVFRLRKLKRFHFLLQEGTTCTFDSFVLSGALRQYFINEEGKEHVIQFAFKDWWISDWSSILTQSPSFYNIEAIEPTEVLQVDISALEKLFDQVPKMEKYFRVMFQKAFAAQQRRILWLQKSAEERYKEFIETYPDFEQKLSQAQIASYLGITRESLSRIKKELLKN
jgi:CRP-like cAMP-binding protein